MTYSIYERLRDGQLEGPRFLLWAVKLATHAGATLLLYCLTRDLMASALIGGPGILLVITARQAYYGHWNPVDKLHDLTLALPPVGGALLYDRRYLPALALLSACALVQRLTRRYATP